MANKLISINVDKTPGTQLPAVVKTEIVNQMVKPEVKTVSDRVTQLAATVAALQTAGIDTAAVQALIDTAIAGIVVSGGGVTQAQVDAAVAAAVANFTLGEKITLAPTKNLGLNTAVSIEAGGNFDDCNIDFVPKGTGLVRINQSPVITAGMEAVLTNKTYAMPCFMGPGFVPFRDEHKRTMFAAALGGDNPQNHLMLISADAGTPARLEAIGPDPAIDIIAANGATLNGSPLVTENDLINIGSVIQQPLFDLLAVKPDATLADVQAVWQALSDQATQHVMLLSLLAGKPLGEAASVADVQAGLPVIIQTLVTAALGRPLDGPLNVTASVTAGVQGDTAEVVAFHPDNKPVNLDLQAPGGQVTVNGQKVQTEGDVIAKVADLLTKSPALGSPLLTNPRIGGTVFTIDGTRVLSLEHVDEKTWLKISNGLNGPEIGVKPGTGSTIDGNIRLRPLGRGVVEIGTALNSATVRVVSDATNADLVLEPQGTGEVKVGGKRVLTTDDALAAGGGGSLTAAEVQSILAAAAQIDPLISTGITDLNNGYAATLLRLKAAEDKNTAQDAEIATLKADVANLKVDVANLVTALQAINSTLPPVVQTEITRLNAEVQAKADRTALDKYATTNALNSAIDTLASGKANQSDYQSLLNALVGAAQLPGNVNKVGEWAEQTRQGLAEQASLGPMLEVVLAKKADKTAFDALEQTVGQVVQNQDVLIQNDADIVQYVLDECATKSALEQFGQDVEFAVGNVMAEVTRLDGLLRKFGDGDTAAACLDEFFATLNDIIGKLLDATGVVPRDGRMQPVAAGDTRIAALEETVGRLAARADDEKTHLEADVLNMLTGGKEVPANIDWTPCKRVAGTGVIEARLINGVVQFRNDLKYTQTAVGSFTTVQRLPDGFPPPSVDTNLTTWAIETQVAYKVGMIRLNINGDIGVSAPTGKFDAITFNGISYPVF